MAKLAVEIAQKKGRASKNAGLTRVQDQLEMHEKAPR